MCSSSGHTDQQQLAANGKMQEDRDKLMNELSIKELDPKDFEDSLSILLKMGKHAVARTPRMWQDSC